MRAGGLMLQKQIKRQKGFKKGHCHAEGLGKGAGLALLAVPMADSNSFVFSQAQFQRILSNYLGLEGAISIPHTHHCGGGATVNHLQVCPVLGRNSAPHDAVRDVLSHLVAQNGVTDAAVVETRLATANGSSRRKNLRC